MTNEENVLWTPTVPSSNFEKGVKLLHLPRRVFQIKFEFEDKGGKIICSTLSFYNVYTLSVKYLEMIEVSRISKCYDKLIESKVFSEPGIKNHGLFSKLSRFEIVFDDGPYLSVVAESWGESMLEK